MKRIISLVLSMVMVFGIIGFVPAFEETAYAASVTPMVAAGGYHTVALKNDGTVWAWGLNGDGQLGDGTATGRATPAKVSNLTGVTQVAAGLAHTAALKNDGTVWAWGCNGDGQLGDGTSTYRKTPVKVSNLTGITKVAAGVYHTTALKNDGTVWAWGYNSHGQLGNGTTIGSKVPVKVSNLTGITQIASGFYHNIALKNDGTVWAWGGNYNGQIGDGTKINKITPIKVSNLTGIIQVTTGESHTVVLKNDGTVWAWGYNWDGQLGDGTTTDRITPVKVSNLTGISQVAAGGFHSAALKNDGTVWTWGYNSYGQLGNSTLTNRTSPVKVSNLTGIAQIAAGRVHTIALKSDGTVWGWGNNGLSQLGDGTTTNRYTPVKVSGLSLGGNIGGSTSPITSDTPVYSTNQQEVLSNLQIDTNNLLDNITCGTHPIKGPSVTILGKTFYLFEFDGKLNFKFKNLNVQAKVDADKKTVQILVGYKIFSESADMGNEYNNSTYWSNSYQQLKSMYKGITGNKVDTTKLWNQFSNIRGQLKELDADLLVDAKCKVAGFMELSYETGAAKFSEGGFLMEASIGGEFVGRISAFPPAYVVLGLEASLEGKIFIAYEQFISINSELNAALAANVGVGLGSKKAKTYLEGGLKGTIGAKMLAVSGSFKDYTSSIDPLVVTVKGDIYLKASLGGFISGEKKWPIGEPVQLYPNNNLSLNSMSLFGEQSLHDVLNESVPIPRDYLSAVKLFALENSDKIYSDSSIYPYNEPAISILPNGDILLIWIDDLGYKNDVNKTSLMYSIFNGVSWSTPTELFETGAYNGSPVIYNNNGKISIVWSKAKTVFDNDASLIQLIEDTELYYTSYLDGSFSEPVKLTDNHLLEVNYKVREENGNIVVAWTENAENDPFLTTGMNKLYIREYKDNAWQEKQLICESENPIDEIELNYINGAVNCIYTIIDADHITRVYHNGGIIGEGAYINMQGNNLYYLVDGKIMEYSLETGTLKETGLYGVNNFSIYNQCAYTLVPNGFSCELFESVYNDGIWSAWKQVTQYGKYIRNYSVSSDSLGEPIYALNLVEVLESQSESVYGSSELAVCKASQFYDLEAASVYYDAEQVKPNSLLTLNVDVKNNGNETVHQITIEILNSQNQVVSTESMECEMNQGEVATISTEYALAENITLHDLTIKVLGDFEERNMQNNEAIASIGYADLQVENLEVVRTETGAALKGDVINVGYSNVENASINVCDPGAANEAIDNIELGNIAAGEKAAFVYNLPVKYLTLEDKMTMHSLSVEAFSDTDEIRYDNNMDKVLFGELTDYTIALVDDNTLLGIIAAAEFQNYAAAKEGYLLEGWYTSNDFTTKITEIPQDISENMVLFAKWVSESEPIKAALKSIEYIENKLTVNLEYEYMLKACDAVIAVYENGKLIGLSIKNVSEGSTSTNSELQLELANKEYEVKVLFLESIHNLNPLSDSIYTTIYIK